MYGSFESTLASKQSQAPKNLSSAPYLLAAIPGSYGLLYHCMSLAFLALLFVNDYVKVLRLLAGKAKFFGDIKSGRKH